MKRKIIDLLNISDHEEESEEDEENEDDEDEDPDEEENNDDNDNEEQVEDEPSSEILDWFSGVYFTTEDLLQRMQPSSSAHSIDYSDRFQLLNGTAYQEAHDDAYSRFLLESVEDEKVKESKLYRLRSVSIQKDKARRFELSSSRGGLVFVAIKSAATKEMEAGVAKVMQCAVCLSIMVDPCTLPCGHSGCLGCLEKCFSSAKGRRCPHCKDAVDMKLKLKVNITLRDSIAIMAPHHVANTSADGNYNALCFQSDASKLRKAVRKHPKSFQDLESEEQDDSDSKSSMEEACYRLCRRAGVIFEDTDVYDELRTVMESFIERITKRIQSLMDDPSEEDEVEDEDDEDEDEEDVAVICADDVIAALRDQHIASTLSACQVYGFGGRYGLRHAFSELILAVVGQGAVTHIDPIALSVVNYLLADFLFMLHDRAVQCGRSGGLIGYLAKVRAGPVNAADLCDGSAHVNLYIEEDYCWRFGVVPKVTEPVHLITEASIQKALTALLSPRDELLKLAIAEGKRVCANTLFNCTYVTKT